METQHEPNRLVDKKFAALFRRLDEAIARYEHAIYRAEQFLKISIQIVEESDRNNSKTWGVTKLRN